MGSDHSFNTILSLGLGNNSSGLFLDDQNKKSTNYPSPIMSFDHTFPSLTLGLSPREAPSRELDVMIDTSKKVEGESTPTGVLYRQSSSISGVSTFSNSSVKRERDVISGGDEFEVENVSSKDIDLDDHDGGARKKLRLTKEQSLVLEESFKEHSTLNPKQKQALAKHLNLRPRQVEVWFQNRRARTKLKQNEVDCELLKKCCDSLTEENRRLQKEIQELKTTKVAAPPCYMQFPAATLTMCPSCERIITGTITDTTNSTSKSSPFSIGSKPHFFRLLNHLSTSQQQQHI